MSEEVQRLIDNEVQRLIDKKEQETRQATWREATLEVMTHSIKSLMGSMNWPVDKAMDALDIPQAQRGTYAELIGRA